MFPKQLHICRAMAYEGFLSLAFLLLTLPLSLSNPSPNPTSFRADLHHRDSVYSPLHDPSASPYALRRLAIERSISRHNALQWAISSKYSPSGLKTEIKRTVGEYLMNITLGTPPQPFWLSFDTGSDVLWTQCEPCEDCFEQDEEKFDPEHSCSYVAINNTAPLCQAYHQGTPTENPCPYEVSYSDNSKSKGELATESFTFENSRGDATQLSGIGFGCGHENTGEFAPELAGVAGLGGGPLSLASQLATVGAGKFSYCLTLGIATDAIGHLIFGDNPVIDGPNTKRTEIIRDPNNPTHHFLKLEDISVGNKRLNVPPGAFDSGGFVIDSSSTLNYLAYEVYGLLTDELKAVIQLEAANDPSTDPKLLLELCYKKPNNFDGIPDITYHFSGGADWKISPHNFFPAMSEDVICLALLPTEEVSIMGNLAQQDMVVQFDVKDNMLSFAPAACLL